MYMRKVLIFLGLFCCGLRASAQETGGYVLGPGDQVSVIVQDLPDEFANKVFRIDTNGDLSLPIVGHIQAEGLTITRLEGELKLQLTHILKNPSISVVLVNFGSQPVSVLGSVNTPGVRQIEGRKTLFEVLSAAGGLRQDAGYEVNVTRDLKWGPIPLKQARTDASGRSSVASIRLSDIIDAANPNENIIILPGDDISVPRAQLVYVIGSVVKSGGFALNEHSSISVLQAVSLAEGLQKTAASDRARILRTVPGSASRTELAVDLKKLLDGRIADVPLKPNDILFIPTSRGKVVTQRSIDVMISMAGAAIWRF
jgi:polysaccharide biosynthesis/export protein